VENFGETSVVVLALTIVMIAVQIVSKWIDNRRNGNGRRSYVVPCPNKIEGLAECLHNVEVNMSRVVEDAAVCKAGVSCLVKQHAPQNGIEQWKIQPRLERLLEQTLEQQREMLDLEKSVVAGIEKLVVATMKMNGNH